MSERYLQKVLERGRELTLLERAAAMPVSSAPFLRVAAAALFGILMSLLPLASAGEELIPFIL